MCCVLLFLVSTQVNLHGVNSNMGLMIKRRKRAMLLEPNRWRRLEDSVHDPWSLWMDLSSDHPSCTEACLQTLRRASALALSERPTAIS